MGQVTAVIAVAAALALPAAAVAAPEPGGYRQNDAGEFFNILPPGQGTARNTLDISGFLAGGGFPPHTHDQFDMYFDLVYNTPGLKRSELLSFYKDASFGVRPADRVRTYSPRGDVTIVRDRFDVPHIYGADRQGAMFGIGYATAENRLFLIDALRHVGRAQTASFAGGGAGNRALDHDVWASSPYTERELELQFERADELYGRTGRLLQQDARSYIAGINAFIAEARLDPMKMPGEYALLGQTLEDFKPSDVIATAALVSGIFGRGGGGELSSAIFLQEARQRLGRRAGTAVWRDFRSVDDPEAPSTIRRRRFPYRTIPRHPRGIAMPDPGSVRFTDVVASRNGGGQSRATAELPDIADILGPLRELNTSSNALLISASESRSGRPLAVMGPQVSYFSPQLLIEQDVHAPGSRGQPPIDARGSGFPGTNLYVQLGRGRDYAWSATSAGQDITDTFALPLCEPGGGRPTINSMHYRYRGACRAFEVLERTNSWVPTPGDQTPAGSETLRALRSKLGLVSARATIKGKPVAFTRLRATYFHEVDPQALGFAHFNNPRKMDTPQEFFRAAQLITTTFNWFYINDRHIAYFNSGANPIRAANTHPAFPVWGKPQFEWRDFDPNALTYRRASIDSHPQIIDQQFLTSWNNKQAPGQTTDGVPGWSPLYRSSALDAQIRKRIAGARKITLPQVVDAMELAGTTDLRGAHLLPWVLKVIDKRPVPAGELRGAVAKLRAWVRAGGHRWDRNRDGTYDQSEAVRIIDAWWPRLSAAVFKPILGETLFGMASLDDIGDPFCCGGAFQITSAGFVQKDLRTLLGATVRGRYSRVYCGRGSLGRCHAALLASLRDALAHDSDGELYPDGSCDGGDAQWCHDAVHHNAVGAVTQPLAHWINRPTFQQVVEIRGRR